MNDRKTLASMGCALALVLMAGTANAEVAPADVKAAEAKAAAAKQHYTLAEYDEAVAAFKEAYKLNPDKKDYLYNIAQAYRQKPACALSATFYKSYLREKPDAEDRAKVEKWIEEMNACAATATTGTGTGTDPGTGTGTGTISTNPGTGTIGETGGTGTGSGTGAGTGESKPLGGTEVPPATGGGGGLGGLRIAGIATGGVGLLALGAGTFFAVRASSLQSSVSEACNSDEGCIWDDVRADDANGKKFATRGKIAFAVGGAALIGGAVMFVLGGKKSSGEAPVALAPTTDGAMLVTSGRF